MIESTQPSLSDDVILDLLDEERNRFTKANVDKMRQLVGLLIARGVYPSETVSANPTRDVFRMVSNYGARWYEWRKPLACPHCHADMRDVVHGPPFKREMSIVMNDRVAYYKCPDCSQRIERE